MILCLFWVCPRSLLIWFVSFFQRILTEYNFLVTHYELEEFIFLQWVFFSFYILQGISLFNFQGPLRTSQPSVIQFFGITSLFPNDFLYSFMFFPGIARSQPSYSRSLLICSLSSDLNIISHFSSFVKSFLKFFYLFLLFYLFDKILLRIFKICGKIYIL